MPGALPAAGQDLNTLHTIGLNADQAAFAREFSAKTGLSEGVVAAWELAEEPANSPYVAQNFNDWLNIDVSGAGPGSAVASDPAFKNPITAADASAAWLHGTAIGNWSPSAGIQSILKSAGQPVAAQVAAINSSGWVGDSTGYPATFAKNAASFNTSLAGSNVAGNAATAAAGAVSGAVNSAEGALTGPVKVAEDIWSAITNPSNWLRALEVLGSVVLIYMALRSLTGVDPAAVVEKGAAVAAVA